MAQAAARESAGIYAPDRLDGAAAARAVHMFVINVLAASRPATEPGPLGAGCWWNARVR